MVAENVDTVSIGMKNLDVLLTSDGIPTGQIGLLVSNPGASGYRLLLEMSMDDPERTCLLTNNHNPNKIDSDINTRFDSDHKPTIEQTHGMDSDQLLEEVEDLDLDQYDVIIMDSIESVKSVNNVGFINQLREICQAQNMVILLHSIEQPVEEKFEFELNNIIYPSDFIFTLMKKRLEQSIRQQFAFHRTPNDCELDVNQNESPVVEMEYLYDNLAIDSGERI